MSSEHIVKPSLPRITDRSGDSPDLPSGIHAETQVGEIWRRGTVIREVVAVPEFASYIRVHETRILRVGGQHTRFRLPTHLDWQRWTAKAERYDNLS